MKGIGISGQSVRGTYPFGVGEDVRLVDTTVRVLAFDQTPHGLDVLLDAGTEVVRRPIREVMVQLLSMEPEAVECGPQPGVLLRGVPVHEQERVMRLYADLTQILTGSRTGDPAADRAAGTWDPRYDLARTNKEDRIRAKSEELKARGCSGWSRATIRRGLAKVEAGGGPEALIGKRYQSSLIGPLVADPEVVEVVAKAVSGEASSARVTNKALYVKARAALKREGLGEDISEYKLRKIVGEVTRSGRLHLEAKARERHARKPDVVYGRRPVSGPGEIVQIDATDTTIHVFDPYTGWASASILSAIDVFTRCVVAMRWSVPDFSECGLGCDSCECAMSFVPFGWGEVSQV